MQRSDEPSSAAWRSLSCDPILCSASCRKSSLLSFRAFALRSANASWSFSRASSRWGPLLIEIASGFFDAVSLPAPPCAPTRRAALGDGRPPACAPGSARSGCSARVCSQNQLGPRLPDLGVRPRARDERGPRTTSRSHRVLPRHPGSRKSRSNAGGSSGGTRRAGRTAGGRPDPAGHDSHRPCGCGRARSRTTTGSAGSRTASRAVISSAMRQLRERRCVSPMARLMFSMWVSTGISRRDGDTDVQRPKSGDSRRTIQRRKRCSRLHGPPSRGQREEMAVAARGYGRRGNTSPRDRPRGTRGRTARGRADRARRRRDRRPRSTSRGSRSAARSSRAAMQKATRSGGRLKR